VPTVALNANTIAYISSQPQAIVTQILNAALMGIVDLVRGAHDLELDFGVAVFKTTARVADVQFKTDLLTTLKDTERVSACSLWSVTRFEFALCL